MPSSAGSWAPDGRLPHELDGERVLVELSAVGGDGGDDAEDDVEHVGGDQDEDADEDQRQDGARDVGEQDRQLEVEGLAGVPPDEGTAVLEHQVADERREPMEDDASDVD